MIYLRYQDKDGRGPFRPGFPAIWGDEDGDSPIGVFEEFPQLASLLPSLHERKLHVGCACYGEQGINEYFTSSERERLAVLGYRLHRVPASSIILKGRDQVVFAWPRPLKTLARYQSNRFAISSADSR